MEGNPQNIITVVVSLPSVATTGEHVFINKTGDSLWFKGCSLIPRAASAGVTAMLEKNTDGNAPGSSDVDLLSAGMSMATADTVATGSRSTTLSALEIADGTHLSLNPSGAVTGGACLVIELATTPDAAGIG